LLGASGSSGTLAGVALGDDEAELEADRVRDTSEWPRKPWLPLKRLRPEGNELGLLFADDIEPPELNSQAADRFRVFGATAETAIALMNPNTGALDGSALQEIGAYDSVEELLDDDWHID
jgi:hypothetical protein